MPAKGKPSPPRKKAASRPRKRSPTKTFTTTSTFSPRLMALKARLEKEIKARFDRVKRRFEYDMHGWRIRRPAAIVAWKGTIDPNYVHLVLAERKQGIALHFWNPYRHYNLKAHAKELGKAGFKVMVGCVNYNRKDDFPVEAILPLLDEARQDIEAESGA